jgi:excisionase family DNA binding protein
MTDDNVIISTRGLPALFTIKQTATHLNVSTKTVRRWIENGDLVSHRIGRGLRVSETDLVSFVRMRRKE